MEEIWNELTSMEMAVRLDTKSYEAVIYQGLKVIKEGDQYVFLSTESDYYPLVSNKIINVFLSDGLEAGMKAFKKDKYERLIKSFGHNGNMKTIQDKLDKL